MTPLSQDLHTITTHIRQEIDEDHWRHFVETHERSNVFHTPEMFEVFRRTKNHSPMFWAAVDSENQIMAMFLPVEVRLFRRMISRWTTRSISYGSILHADHPQGVEGVISILDSYKNWARKRHLFTELRNVVDLNDLQPVLNKLGFHYEDHLNYLINLNCTADEVFQNIGRRTRKHIRKALRDNEVSIMEVDDHKLVEICYELVAKTYAHNNIPKPDRSLFQAARDVLLPKGMVKFLLARIQNNYIAASVELLYKDVIYGWFSGIDRTFSRYMPNELLTWYILRWGNEHGYKTYDFGGAGKPTEEYGVRDFKAKFGGRLVCFGRNTFVHAPKKLQLSNYAYRLLRPWLFSQ